MRQGFLAGLVIAGALAAPRATGAAEPGKVLVERFTAAANAHDLAALDALVAEDFVRHCQATPDVKVSSLADFKQFLTANRAIFPDEKVTLTQLVEEGDRVAFWGSYTGTQAAPMGPFPASGKKTQLDMAGVFRVTDGKLAELWIVWDNLTALVQLGHFSPPAPEAR